MTAETSEYAKVLAGQVRDACVVRFLEVFESAQISGLCCEGALEVAIGQLRVTDPELLLAGAPDTTESAE